MTYKHLIETMDLIAKNLGNQETKTQKKLVKIYDKLKKYYDVYDDRRNELRLEHSSIDDKGNLIFNEKGDYTFTKDGIKNMQKDLKHLLDTEFIFEKINVVNPAGLEDHYYLSEYLDGVNFNNQDDEEDTI